MLARSEDANEQTSYGRDFTKDLGVWSVVRPFAAGLVLVATDDLTTLAPCPAPWLTAGGDSGDKITPLAVGSGQWAVGRMDTVPGLPAVRWGSPRYPSCLCT